MNKLIGIIAVYICAMTYQQILGEGKAYASPQEKANISLHMRTNHVIAGLDLYFKGKRSERSESEIREYYTDGMDGISEALLMGADINVPSPEVPGKGQTVLFKLMRCDPDLPQSKALIKYVLEKGADPNQTVPATAAFGPAGKTPLMYAAILGQLEWVEFLLSHGADPSIKDQHGFTAAAYAVGGSRGGFDFKLPGSDSVTYMDVIAPMVGWPVSQERYHSIAERLADSSFELWIIEQKVDFHNSIRKRNRIWEEAKAFTFVNGMPSAPFVLVLFMVMPFIQKQWARHLLASSVVAISASMAIVLEGLPAYGGFLVTGTWIRPFKVGVILFIISYVLLGFFKRRKPGKEV